MNVIRINFYNRWQFRGVYYGVNCRGCGMTKIVTTELKTRIYDLFEKHDKMIEEQDECIEWLRDEVKQLRKENRLIDENAAAVQKEYKKEIERLQSAYLRAVTERDNAIFQLTRCEAERDKAVEDLKEITKYNGSLTCNCNEILDIANKWRGLGRKK